MLNKSASLSVTQTESFISWIRFLRSEIECFSMPLPRALERCPREIYEGCGYTSDVPPTGIEDLIKKCRIADGEVNRQLTRFCEDIGKGYREEQLSLCDYCLELLEARRRELAAELPTRRKLNSALCLSGALALVILLI